MSFLQFTCLHWSFGFHFKFQSYSKQEIICATQDWSLRCWRKSRCISSSSARQWSWAFLRCSTPSCVILTSEQESAHLVHNSLLFRTRPSPGLWKYFSPICFMRLSLCVSSADSRSLTFRTNSRLPARPHSSSSIMVALSIWFRNKRNSFVVFGEPSVECSPRGGGEGEERPCKRGDGEDRPCRLREGEESWNIEICRILSRVYENSVLFFIWVISPSLFCFSFFFEIVCPIFFLLNPLCIIESAVRLGEFCTSIATRLPALGLNQHFYVLG